MTEVQQLEQLMNEMLPGLQLFARDINLTPEEASKFQVGQIVRNAAFTDATSRVGGMVTTHRFSILSNHLFDLTKAEHGTNWGLQVRIGIVDVILVAWILRKHLVAHLLGRG